MSNEEAKIYTEEELRAMRRLDARTIASSLWGLDKGTASTMPTSEVVRYILEKQAESKSGGNGKGAGSKGGKGKSVSAAAATGRKKAPEPEPEEPQDANEDGAVDGGQINALGLALDSLAGDTKQALETLAETILSLKKQVFVASHLLKGLYIGEEGAEGLEEALTVAEEEWEKEGNA
jgi:hypothetical protein